MNIFECVLCARDCVCYTGLICLLLITKFKIRKFYVDMRAWCKCGLVLCVATAARNIVCMQICNRDPISFSCIICLEDILCLFHCARVIWKCFLLCVRIMPVADGIGSKEIYGKKGLFIGFRSSLPMVNIRFSLQKIN